MDNDNNNQNIKNSYFYINSPRLILNLPEYNELYKRAFFMHCEGSSEYCENTTTYD